MSDKEEYIRARLAHKDFFDCVEVRRTALIDNYAHLFHGMRVLELGAHVGFFSHSLLKYSKEVVLIENNPACVQVLKQQFGKNVQIIEEDLHHQLWKLEPGHFDIIVCAGILYHSASPFFMLEGMAHLKPQRLLIDSLIAWNGEVELVLMPPVNVQNFRYNYRKDSGASVRLSPRTIDAALVNLGFTEVVNIDKNALTIDPSRDSKYFQEWKNCYSKWWKNTES